MHKQLSDVYGQNSTYGYEHEAFEKAKMKATIHTCYNSNEFHNQLLTRYQYYMPVPYTYAKTRVHLPTLYLIRMLFSYSNSISNAAIVMISL